jgi:hypothetical protein
MSLNGNSARRPPRGRNATIRDLKALEAELQSADPA